MSFLLQDRDKVAILPANQRRLPEPALPSGRIRLCAANHRESGQDAILNAKVQALISILGWHARGDRTVVPAGEVIEYAIRIYSFSNLFKAGHRIQLELMCNLSLIHI